VTPRKVEWLWPGRIPVGKLTTLAGQMGVGKAQPLDSRVLTPRGWVRMGDVRPGDVVAAAAGAAAGVVTHVVRTAVAATTHCVALRGGLVLTAWHPVRLEGDAAWSFPAHAGAHIVAAGTAALFGLSQVFSIALAPVAGDAGGGGGAPHGAIVDGVRVATLGHGVEGDAVLTHSLYGTRRVLDDADVVARWAVAAGRAAPDGVIDVGGDTPWAWHTDEATGLIDGIRWTGPVAAAPVDAAHAPRCASAAVLASA
jgi:hypothetical protein